MPTVHIDSRDVQAARGARLCDVLPGHHTVEMPCAGQGRCGKCRVRALGALSAISDTERRFLTPQELADGIRLACCTHVEGDCTVSLPGAARSHIRLDGAMPEFEHAPLFRRFGAAVDVGTTTLAARLYGPGGQLAQAAAPNPQASFGADVISRIQAALGGRGDALAACVREGIAALLQALAGQAGVACSDIDTLVVTGNTAMLYLLTGRWPDCLAHAPFEADHLFGETVPAAVLGLPCPGAQVYLPRCMSAFVGADITCSVLASGMCSADGTSLLADIGTNGEMALWHGGVLSCCSTAAGPAFEGAGLSMGMAGKDGAVDHVCLVNGILSAHVLGGGSARGICGSGVIDALACLLRLGILDESGCLDDDPTAIAGDVSLSQRDVRMVQLAKSAVCAGICTLSATAGLPLDAIPVFHIAGGFGSYLDVGSAAAIGLIPAVLADRARVLGNASLTGASMLLLNRAFLPFSEHMADAAHTVDLTASPLFNDAYMEGMLFPSL